MTGQDKYYEVTIVNKKSIPETKIAYTLEQATQIFESENGQHIALCEKTKKGFLLSTIRSSPKKYISS